MGLIVVVLLGSIAAFTVMAGALTYSGLSLASSIGQAKVELQAHEALERVERYHVQHGEWPPDLPTAYAPDPVPVDEWGNPLSFGWEAGPLVRSLGPDGLPGSDDIEVHR